MKRRIENIAGVVKHALLKAGDDESPQAIIKGFLDCFEVLPHEQILIDDLLESPAPQNAAGDNWISVDKNKPEMWKWLYVAVDTKDAEVYRYFVQEANFYMDGQFFDSHHKPIKDVAFWKYKKTPSPPTATAEQDKNDKHE